MFHDELKTGVRRNGILLLALAIAMALGMVGCGEHAAPPIKQEAVTLTPEQEFAELLQKGEAGNAYSQYIIGVIYANGSLVQRGMSLNGGCISTQI
jgi:hypothetical protein